MNEPRANSNGSPSPSQEVAPREYQFLREFLRKQIGSELGDERQYLVTNRLAPIAAAYDLEDVNQLIARLRLSSDHRLHEAIVEAMTINETSFFRGGPILFDAVARVMIPALAVARASQRRLRIWCGACSTGQEPYSLAITLADRCPQLAGWRIEMLATDVSQRALDQAQAGDYNQFEAQRGLPIQTLLTHFTKREDRWHISEALVRRVEFRKHNLLDSFLMLQPPFDIIFLRNVLIYFDHSAKAALFDRLRQAIAPDGFLVLGETESVLGVTDRFTVSSGESGFFRPV